MYKTTSSRHNGQHQRLIYYLFSGKTEIHSICLRKHTTGMWLLIPRIERGAFCFSSSSAASTEWREQKKPQMTPPDQMRVLMNVPLGASVVSAAVQGDESSCVRLTSEQPPPLRTPHNINNESDNNTNNSACCSVRLQSTVSISSLLF